SDQARRAVRPCRRGRWRRRPRRLLRSCKVRWCGSSAPGPIHIRSADRGDGPLWRGGGRSVGSFGSVCWNDKIYYVKYRYGGFAAIPKYSQCPVHRITKNTITKIHAHARASTKPFFQFRRCPASALIGRIKAAARKTIWIHAYSFTALPSSHHIRQAPHRGLRQTMSRNPCSCRDA